jgi:hypothetical protein
MGEWFKATEELERFLAGRPDIWPIQHVMDDLAEFEPVLSMDPIQLQRVRQRLQNARTTTPDQG